MKSLSFRKDLVGVQDELLRFAYKLTTDREEANDLLQETSLKALDNEDKYTPRYKFQRMDVYHHAQYIHKQLPQGSPRPDIHRPD